MRGDRLVIRGVGDAACVPPLIALLLLGEASSLSVTPARAAAANTVTPCALYGFSIDRDPAGLRVRAGPSRAARVVGRLPGYVIPRDDSEYGPAFRITGSSNGWLRIVEANDNYNNGRPRPTYSGTGWVHGSMVRVAVQGRIGRVSPDATARALVDTGGDWLVDRAGFTAVTSCSGRWAKVRYAIRDVPNRFAVPRSPVRGQRAGEAWFTGICGGQRTPCEGVHEGS